MLTKTQNDWFLGDKYTYTPETYQKYGAYNPYSSMLGQTARNSLQSLMSGSLSDSTNQLLNQRFSQNLASVREGAYGMPLGAQKGLEVQQAGQNALEAAQLAEQQRNFAIQQALPWEQEAGSQNYLGYQTGLNDSRYAQEWARKEQSLSDEINTRGAYNTNGFLGTLGTAAGSILGGIAGRLGGEISNGIFGDETVNRYKALMSAGILGDGDNNTFGNSYDIPAGVLGNSLGINPRYNSQNGYMFNY